MPTRAQISFELLSLLSEEPDLSQREISERLGVSLGKVNYLVKALVEKGLLKAESFYKSSAKRSYIYTITPRGVLQKARLTIQFLRRKEEERKSLLKEIELLRVAAKEIQKKHPEIFEEELRNEESK